MRIYGRFWVFFRPSAHSPNFVKEMLYVWWFFLVCVGGVFFYTKLLLCLNEKGGRILFLRSYWILWQYFWACRRCHRPRIRFKSKSPEDVNSFVYCRSMLHDCDCVFGRRWGELSMIIDLSRLSSLLDCRRNLSFLVASPTLLERVHCKTKKNSKCVLIC